ncbi:SH3 domain-containing protein [Planomonospora sp. ID67723]|uniref:SH3 domain-containing protein n=1 Tax=Planomonospora sp. ID67723 TaxID=2738134 RepID=UPI0018C36978|nr:SH3 domain-containing protein [Planomonospora sp. ID67723]MBG0833416.1 SH3 domain-containing protein [Planomonospora sp. ID67723]
MIFKRLAGALIAAAVAGGGTVVFSAATATAAEAATCSYRVRNVPAGSALAVREAPFSDATVIDVLRPGQITFGRCKKERPNWRAVTGVGGNDGYSHRRYLKKLYRLS